MKTRPGRGARFDFVERWILHHVDSPGGLQLSGNLARAYFKPGEIGNPRSLSTPEAISSWGAHHRIEVRYVERSDIYFLSRAREVTDSASRASRLG